MKLKEKNINQEKGQKNERCKLGWLCQTHDLSHKTRINHCKANQNKLWSSILNQSKIDGWNWKKNIAKNNNQKNENQIWHKELTTLFFSNLERVKCGNRWEERERREKKIEKKGRRRYTKPLPITHTPSKERHHKYDSNDISENPIQSPVKCPQHAGTCITYTNNSFPMVYDFSRKGAKNFVWVQFGPYILYCFEWTKNKLVLSNWASI